MRVYTALSAPHSSAHSSLFCLVPVWLCLPRCQAAITPTTFLEDAPRPPRHSHPSWHKVAHTVPLAYGTRRLRWSGEEYGCWRVLVLVYLFTVQLGPKAQTECDGARLSTTTGHAFATVLPPGPATCFPHMLQAGRASVGELCVPATDCWKRSRPNRTLAPCRRSSSSYRKSIQRRLKRRLWRPDSSRGPLQSKATWTRWSYSAPCTSEARVGRKTLPRRGGCSRWRQT